MTKKQTSWIVIIFFFTLLTSLVIGIPVRHLLQFVKLPPEIKLQGLQGTITNGSVKLIRYKKFQLTDVNFNFQPTCLLKAGLCYQLKSLDKNFTLNIEANLISQNILMNQSQIQLDSEVLKQLPPLLVQPRGELVIFIESLSFADSKISNLIARIDWLDAGIQGEEQLLGNYIADIKQEVDKLSIKLGDKNSLLSVTGDIEVNWKGQYEADVKLESRPKLNKSVISVLEMSVKKTGINRFTLKKTGGISPGGLNLLKLFDPNA